MKKQKSSSDRKSTYGGKSQFACEIKLIGGSFDGKTFRVIFPSPKYLILAMGRELYERQDPGIVVEATYRYTDNWAPYKQWSREQEKLLND